MPISSTATPLANVLDSMTTEGAPELTEHLEAGALKCYACGHRCLIKLGKRGICKVRFNEAGELRVPYGYVGALRAEGDHLLLITLRRAGEVIERIERVAPTAARAPDKVVK